MIRPLLLSLAALFTVPATAHAADDDVCVGWVHVFVDAEVDGDELTVTSENACLLRGASIDDLEGDGRPYLGGFPEYSGSRECAELDHLIDDMRQALRDAIRRWPEVVKARDESATKESDALTAYEQARATWEAAQAVTRAAKAAYEDGLQGEPDRLSRGHRARPSGPRSEAPRGGRAEGDGGGVGEVDWDRKPDRASRSVSLRSLPQHPGLLPARHRGGRGGGRSARLQVATPSPYLLCPRQRIRWYHRRRDESAHMGGGVAVRAVRIGRHGLRGVVARSMR